MLNKKLWDMALIRPLNGIAPKIGEDTFIAETATIIGDVEIGDNCSIWYGAVLRGDVNSIRIGNRVNIQDNAVIHTAYQNPPPLLRMMCPLLTTLLFMGQL